MYRRARSDRTGARAGAPGTPSGRAGVGKSLGSFSFTSSPPGASVIVIAGGLELPGRQAHDFADQAVQLPGLGRGLVPRRGLGLPGGPRLLAIGPGHPLQGLRLRTAAEVERPDPAIDAGGSVEV